MTARTRAFVAWGAMGLCVAFAVGGLIGLALLVPESFEWGGVAVGATMLTAPAVGALIVSRTSNLVGWLLLVVGLVGTLTLLLGSVADSSVEIPGQVWVAWVANWVWPLSLGSLVLILQVFPDGRPLSRRWRWLLWLTGLAILSLVVGGAFSPGQLGDYEHLSNPLGIEALEGTPLAGEENPGWPLLILAILGSVASLVFRYRRSRGERRQQLKWLAYAATLFGLGWLGIVFTWDSPRLALAGEVFFGIGLLSLPVAIGISVLKYRLYDIDLVVNKTVVYALLAGFITAVYVGVVVGLGSVIGTTGEPNLGLQVAATALVAVAFQPVRERVQRLANRLVYGRRASPYETLSRFSDRVAGAYGAEDILPRTARVVAEGTGAKHASVWLRVGGELREAARWPSQNGHPTPVPLVGEDVPDLPGADRTLAVRHGEEILGALAVTKGPGDPFRPQEEALLADLVSQAGLVLRNVRLTEELRVRVEEVSRLAEDLRRSRRRLVATQDAARRRLERDIHDGAQQHLVALAVQLKLAQTVAAKDPAKARPVLERLVDAADSALANLRDLTRGVYPPLLEAEGLAGALRAEAARSPIPVTVEADGVGRAPLEVEAAAYFCVLEALQNAAKYAEADRVEVHVARDHGHLAFEVRDDGRGFDPSAIPRGSGLPNMADRLGALGGTLEVRSAPGEGTTVAGRIPVSAPAVERAT